MESQTSTLLTLFALMYLDVFACLLRGIFSSSSDDLSSFFFFFGLAARQGLEPRRRQLGGWFGLAGRRMRFGLAGSRTGSSRLSRDGSSQPTVRHILSLKVQQQQ